MALVVKKTIYRVFWMIDIAIYRGRPNRFTLGNISGGIQL
jgi:hypothetical protein